MTPPLAVHVIVGWLVAGVGWLIAAVAGVNFLIGLVQRSAKLAELDKEIIGRTEKLLEIEKKEREIEVGAAATQIDELTEALESAEQARVAASAERSRAVASAGAAIIGADLATRYASDSLRRLTQGDMDRLRQLPMRIADAVVPQLVGLAAEADSRRRSAKVIEVSTSVVDLVTEVAIEGVSASGAARSCAAQAVSIVPAMLRVAHERNGLAAGGERLLDLLSSELDRGGLAVTPGGELRLPVLSETDR